VREYVCLWFVLLGILAAAAPAHADYLTVTRTATVRAEPTSRATALSKQEPGSTLSLVQSDLQNGYYAVTDPGTNRPGWVYKTFVRRYADDPVAAVATPHPPIRPIDCASKVPMRVHFYDVGQALSVLVDLPDSRRILVDAGESATRPGCGVVCRDKNAHLLQRLAEDLNGAHISMIWMTHQHSDHIGGAADVLNRFPVDLYVDNGQSLGKAQVKHAREVAISRSTKLAVVDTSSTDVPLANAGDALTFRPVVPPAWPDTCEDDPNDCSIGLRIDYCSSSVLFTGDAEALEEETLDPGGVTLLQVGHHGSNTSSSSSFISKVAPKYAVISAGRKGEGLNKTYCHPRKVTVANLSSVLGGPKTQSILSFEGASCRRGKESDWEQVPASDRIWSTSRDGDVSLMTVGDGVFVQEKRTSTIANQ
jgi:competence protein ComEC